MEAAAVERAKKKAEKEARLVAQKAKEDKAAKALAKKLAAAKK